MSDMLNNCARELMETAPQIMQSIRVEMRRGRGTHISIPQFRTLRFIQRNPESSLSKLAELLGLTLPSISKLVDGLVENELVIRKDSIVDRRRITLQLTEKGDSIVNSAREMAQQNLVKILSSLSENELDSINNAMKLLNPLFAQHGKSIFKSE